ncbi:hypothetical protein OSTOST_16512 [Ostertagia ostertagi]
MLESTDCTKPTFEYEFYSANVEFGEVCSPLAPTLLDGILSKFAVKSKARFSTTLQMVGVISDQPSLITLLLLDMHVFVHFVIFFLYIDGFLRVHPIFHRNVLRRLNHGRYNFGGGKPCQRNIVSGCVRWSHGLLITFCSLFLHTSLVIGGYWPGRAVR